MSEPYSVGVGKLKLDPSVVPDVVPDPPPEVALSALRRYVGNQAKKGVLAELLEPPTYHAPKYQESTYGSNLTSGWWRVLVRFTGAWSRDPRTNDYRPAVASFRLHFYGAQAADKPTRYSWKRDPGSGPYSVDPLPAADLVGPLSVDSDAAGGRSDDFYLYRDPTTPQPATGRWVVSYWATNLGFVADSDFGEWVFTPITAALKKYSPDAVDSRDGLATAVVRRWLHLKADRAQRGDPLLPDQAAVDAPLTPEQLALAASSRLDSFSRDVFHFLDLLESSERFPPQLVALLDERWARTCADPFSSNSFIAGAQRLASAVRELSADYPLLSDAFGVFPAGSSSDFSALYRTALASFELTPSELGSASAGLGRPEQLQALEWVVMTRFANSLGVHTLTELKLRGVSLLELREHVRSLFDRQ